MPIKKGRKTPPRGFKRGISRSQSFKDLKLKPGENLKVYALVPDSEASPYPQVVDPLNPGETQPLIDIETGLPMPYSVNKGHNWKVIRLWSAGTNSHRGRMSVDGNYFFQYLKEDYDIYYEQEIEEFHIGLIDPDFSDSHTVEITATNDGTDKLEGVFMIHALEIKEKTPPFPDMKTVRCQNCGHKKEVDREKTEWKCPKCGTLNKFFCLRRKQI